VLTSGRALVFGPASITSTTGEATGGKSARTDGSRVSALLAFCGIVGCLGALRLAEVTDPIWELTTPILVLEDCDDVSDSQSQRKPTIFRVEAGGSKVLVKMS